MGQASICQDLERSLGVQIIECRGWRVRGVYRILARLRGLELGFLAFIGRESYRPWVEFDVTTSSGDIYGALEEILPRLQSVMGRGLRIMIPYIWDRETTSLLDRGIHPGATRLGSLLILSGYYLVRDMYFPEGFAEGDPKLVGEGFMGNRWYLESLAEELRDLENHLSRGCSGDPSCLYAERSLAVLSSILKSTGYK